MDLERAKAMLEEAEKSLDEAIINRSPDFKYWRGYRDAMTTVIRFLEEP